MGITLEELEKKVGHPNGRKFVEDMCREAREEGKTVKYFLAVCALGGSDPFNPTDRDSFDKGKKSYDKRKSSLRKRNQDITIFERDYDLRMKLGKFVKENYGLTQEIPKSALLGLKKFYEKEDPSSKKMSNEQIRTRADSDRDFYLNNLQ